MKGFCRARFAIFRLLLAVLFGFSASAVMGQRVDDLPNPTDYVSDNAHVLSAETIARLDSICGQLDHTAANAQVAVVTVQSLDGADTADYAIQLEDKWGMGKKGSDRGVLVLLATGDHKYRIDAGIGLQGILPDAKLGDIGREMVPYLRASDYDGAVTVALDKVAQVIAADAKVTLDEQPVPASAPAPEEHHSAVLGKLILLIFLLIFFGGSSLLRLLFGFSLFSSLFGGGYRDGGGGFSGGGGGGGGFGGFGGGGFDGGGAGGSW